MNSFVSSANSGVRCHSMRSQNGYLSLLQFPIGHRTHSFKAGDLVNVGQGLYCVTFDPGPLFGNCHVNHIYSPASPLATPWLVILFLI